MGKKPVKLCVVTECGDLKGEDWGIFPKDDGCSDFTKDAGINLKDVDKSLLIAKDLKMEIIFSNLRTGRQLVKRKIFRVCG